jgi:hypothetical protein
MVHYQTLQFEPSQQNKQACEAQTPATSEKNEKPLSAIAMHDQRLSRSDGEAPMCLARTYAFSQRCLPCLPKRLMASQNGWLTYDDEL